MLNTGSLFVISSSFTPVMNFLSAKSKFFSTSNSISSEIVAFSFSGIIIGCSQVFALIPGFSRSGTTIASARCLKVDRESAAKFSFYLSAPVVLGACVLQLLDDGAVTLIMENATIFIIGIIVSFITGLICIKFLLQYLKKHDFKLFMIYRIILAIIVILTVIF